MSLIKAISAILITLSSCACASIYNRSNSRLSLEKLEKTNFQTLTLEQAESLFGHADINELVGSTHSEQVLVYLRSEAPRAPLLTLIFDNNNKKIISANWFVDKKSNDSNFENIKNRYSEYKINLNKPKSEIGPYGDKLLQYSIAGPLVIFVNENSRTVEGISWVYNTEDNVVRKPTSH